jgi:hypothetical protein
MGGARSLTTIPNQVKLQTGSLRRLDARILFPLLLHIGFVLADTF